MAINLFQTKSITLLLLLSMLLFGCKNSSKKESVETTKPTEKVYTKSIYGNYVTDNYLKRSEGFDWIAVTVKRITASAISISIRSRADKKKPTCTLDCKAQKVNDNLYKSTLDGKIILFNFEDNSINISTENPEESDFLNYYCNGGASIKGVYNKLNEVLDIEQIDASVFNKNLYLQNIGFNIKSYGSGSIQQLTIEPYGLSIDNRKETIEIDGRIVDAEIEDLNSDGFPEILIYTQSAGSGSYGNVIGYSVNNGKSMSRISFNNVSNNKEANDGYMGHDQFKIIETSLVQRFPIYLEGDTNSNPTGKIRQVQYTLKDGEASRIFVIQKITEFNR